MVDANSPAQTEFTDAFGKGFISINTCPKIVVPVYISVGRSRHKVFTDFSVSRNSGFCEIPSEIDIIPRSCLEVKIIESKINIMRSNWFQIRVSNENIQRVGKVFNG